MTGFAGVNKKGGGAGTGECGGNLIANMPRLSHAGNHHSPFTVEHGLAGCYKVFVEAAQKLFDSIGFHFNGALCGG